MKIISCIMTAFNEGRLIEYSIESILSQSFTDFELIIVDDGASEETRESIHKFKDERIRVITRMNGGLSSARNRGIDASSGKYVCFLDADDFRPSWALQAMNDACTDEPDCVFSPGVLHELRNQTLPFYDQAIFNQLTALDPTELCRTNSAESIDRALALLLCLEPQCANKLVRREFLTKYCLKFPAGLFFEDIVFHFGVLANLESWSVTKVPTFTYFRRYGRPQITSSNTALRFDALGSCELALSVFAASRRFHHLGLRQVALASACKILAWCYQSVSLDLRDAFDIGIRDLFAKLDRRYFWSLSTSKDEKLIKCCPWIEASLTFASSRWRP